MEEKLFQNNGQSLLIEYPCSHPFYFGRYPRSPFLMMYTISTTMIWHISCVKPNNLFLETQTHF